MLGFSNTPKYEVKSSSLRSKINHNDDINNSERSVSSLIQSLFVFYSKLTWGVGFDVKKWVVAILFVGRKKARDEYCQLQNFKMD